MTFCKLVVCFCFLFAVTLHSKPIISLQSERNDFPVISTKRSAWRDLRRFLRDFSTTLEMTCEGVKKRCSDYSTAFLSISERVGWM